MAPPAAKKKTAPAPPGPAAPVAPPVPPGIRPSTAPHDALHSNIAAAHAAATAAQPDPAQGPGPDRPIPGAPGELLQVRFNPKDLPPLEQGQLAQHQLGIDPYMPIEAGQQAVGQAAQAGGGTGPTPNELTSPLMGLPPEVQNFPHDFAALQHSMHMGFSPGASDGEHAVAQNAHAIARAQESHAQQAAQNVQMHQQAHQQLGGIMQNLVSAGAPPAAAGPPPMQGLPSGIAPPPGPMIPPPAPASPPMGAPPAPGAPPMLPPALIAAMQAAATKRHAVGQ